MDKIRNDPFLIESAITHLKDKKKEGRVKWSGHSTRPHRPSDVALDEGVTI